NLHCFDRHTHGKGVEHGAKQGFPVCPGAVRVPSEQGEHEKGGHVVQLESEAAGRERSRHGRGDGEKKQRGRIYDRYHPAPHSLYPFELRSNHSSGYCMLRRGPSVSQRLGAEKDSRKARRTW